MEFTITYIISQVFTIMMYGLLGITYQIKSRMKRLLLSISANTFQAIAYILLNAKSGFIMCIFAIIRDVSIINVSKIKNEKKEKIANIGIIVLFYIGMIISAIYTYEGLYSLLSIFATSIYTFSIWQKNEKIYKFLGIPVSTCWILYNSFVKSVFGVIIESVLLISLAW